jgi:integrase
MARRVWRPAVDGTAQTGPILDGMRFHDTRHTHKTWLIEDDIPEIAQTRRLGHRLSGVRGVYGHVTPVMIARITNSIQARWQASHTPTSTAQRHLHAA